MATFRGNPKWCHVQVLSDTPTQSAFEMLTKKLGLQPEQFEDSTLLKEWARKNQRQRFVPPELLQAWGFRS
jgi:hypothetical protein